MNSPLDALFLAIQKQTQFVETKGKAQVAVAASSPSQNLTELHFHWCDGLSARSTWIYLLDAARECDWVSSELESSIVFPIHHDPSFIPPKYRWHGVFSKGGQSVYIILYREYSVACFQAGASMLNFVVDPECRDFRISQKIEAGKSVKILDQSILLPKIPEDILSSPKLGFEASRFFDAVYAQLETLDLHLKIGHFAQYVNVADRWANSVMKLENIYQVNYPIPLWVG
jgi:hypothetical protein